VKVAVTRVIPEAGLAMLRAAADVALWDQSEPPSRADLVTLGRGCDGLLTLLTDPVDGDLLDELPTVRVVSNFAVGFDNVDVPACTARGVAVCTTPDVLTETTADYAFALLMAVARRVVDGARSAAAGAWKTWEPMGFLGPDVHGATVGIIGMGRIGSAVAARAHGFGMRILYADSRPAPDAEASTGAERRDIDHVLRESDFVTLHVPLLAETRGLIGTRELKLMKPTATLINTSRGPVVQTQALVQALQEGTIWGAGLDVTDPEPLPADSPLLSMARVVITPHIASASEATRARMAELAAANVIAVLRGDRPPRCLNPEVLTRG